MKANYKNWVPKGMLNGLMATFSLLTILIIVIAVNKWHLPYLPCFLGVIDLAVLLIFLWMLRLYRAFDYNGKRQLSRQIIDGIASYIDLSNGGQCLDVGCGSGALTIAVAKNNPAAKVIGVDRWGKEYASFNKTLCENNAIAEGAFNTSFEQGDALNLNYPDEFFDAVTSNYVYHNIRNANKQECLLETLRTLKKGGYFAIHDLMSQARYGDMDDFVNKLKSMGYEKVELIDTTQGLFMTHKEARQLLLYGSKLLRGVK